LRRLGKVGGSFFPGLSVNEGAYLFRKIVAIGISRHKLQMAATIPNRTGRKAVKYAPIFLPALLHYPAAISPILKRGLLVWPISSTSLAA
jgi:hypothetical protein